jgi:arylsulfatase A-like enzyme
MPGSTHGIPDWAPTIADLLKDQGYTSGQFGKNHLGDQDEHLPTVHGFDEFYGNLYHLNAEEEPETYYYPKDPEFRARFGPRGVIHSYADGRIEDTGPLTRERMETVDEEFHEAAMAFIERAHAEGKPFFVWYNATRMHVWTRLKPESVGRTGIGLYPDGMVEHDDMVGRVLAKLDELGIADNTIVIYSTDNGAETFTWPDGGTTPFHGEKGTTWEGGFRVPALVRWPGTITPGTIYNNIMSQEDWMPTLLHAAGVPGVKEKLKQGYEANGKTWRVHLDGYDFLPFFRGEVQESPRNEIVYFSQGGELNAVRFRDWKVHFAMQKGNIATAVREVTGWPAIVNLRADPWEQAMFEGDMGYLRWYADNMWIFVPIQTVIREFLATIKDYPFQPGSSLNAAGINYQTLRAAEALERIEMMTNPIRPNN